MRQVRWVALLGCFCGCVLSASAGPTTQNFDGGGTPFVLSNYQGPAPTIVPAGNPGNAVQLTYAGTGFTQNSIDFVRTQTGPFVKVTGDFDFRINAGGAADGFNFSLVNTASYGTSGSVGVPNSGVEEEPNFTGSLGLEFDTFNNGGEDVSGDELGVHFNNANIKSVDLGALGYHLNEGEYQHVHFTVTPVAGGSNLTVTLSGPGNPTVTPFSGLIPGLAPYESRVTAGARTGGAAEDVFLDNINVDFGAVTVPEPATLILAGVGLASLVGYGWRWRRRVA